MHWANIDIEEQVDFGLPVSKRQQTSMSGLGSVEAYQFLQSAHRQPVLRSGADAMAS